MVRTRADATARKAVAAKAPRKVLGSSGGGGGASCAGMASPSGKGAKYAGGNQACPRPVPEWQKGIGSFLVKSPKAKDKENAAPEEAEGEGSAAGSCSQGGSSSASEEACSSSVPSSPPERNGIISDDED